VAQDGERVGVARVPGGQDVDRAAVLERQAQVAHAAVLAHEYRLLGKLRADRAGGVEPGGAVGKLELGGVGKDDLHPRKDTASD